MMNGRIKRPNPESASPGIPRLGWVKIGAKNEKGYPVSLDHFIASGKYSEAFSREIGRTNKLEITFMSDDPAISCLEQYEYYDSEGRLFADGNGETFRVWDQRKEKYSTYQIEKWPSLMQDVERVSRSQTGWNITLTLNFVVLKLNKIMGYWSFKTKGEVSSIKNIRESFDYFLNKKGTVVGVPFDLTVEMVKSNKPGVRSRYPVVNLIANAMDYESIEFINPKKMLK